MAYSYHMATRLHVTNACVLGKGPSRPTEVALEAALGWARAL